MKPPIIESLREYIAHDISAKECPIWRSVAPQKAAMPYAVLTEISNVPAQDELIGTGPLESSWQLDVYTSSQGAAELLLQRFVRRLNRSGETLQWSCGEVLYLRVTSVMDTTDLEMEDGSAGRVARRTIEFETIIQ